MIGPISYIGGKNRLAKQIIARIPEHTTYVEAFAGGAQVFFRKPPSKVEILNDLSDDIVCFFRVCQFHNEELIRHLRAMVTSRRWFDILWSTPVESLTDVQRAARFLYLQRNAYAGQVVRKDFVVSVIKRCRFNPARVADLIERTHERLASAAVECLPYEKVLTKYDRPTTFFYLDPPYWGKKLYQFNFKEEDFTKMASLLTTLKGRFLLSINDVPEVRKLFSSFNITKVRLHYTAPRNAGSRYTELLISNY